MHYTTKKYFSALSIGLLLSQPLSAMHYLDRKLFAGCCIGALGTMGILFIKKHFFTGKPAMPKSISTKNTDYPEGLPIVLGRTKGDKTYLFIPKNENSATYYEINKNNNIKNNNSFDVTKKGKAKAVITPGTDGFWSWEIPLNKSGATCHFKRNDGEHVYTSEGRDLL
ncbi:MAG TPA: hypothetical protein VGW78_01010 [Candidatus Babeliales bacterium]|jgi:hypothetical protein|nr:hypothetical protein [Candidatus Babeliales bacterium]